MTGNEDVDNMTRLVVQMDLSNSASEKVEMIYQIIFFVFGTPLNAVSLVQSTKLFRRSRDGADRLVKMGQQLIIAHLLVLCIYCVWRTYWFMNVVWTQGDLLCKIYSVASALPFHLWSNMVAAIGIDMLCCITSPLSSYRTSSTRVTWLITISWFAALFCSLPMAIFRGAVKIPGTEFEQCYPVIDRYSDEVLFLFNLFHVITTFYVPLTIVVLCYTLIGLSLRRQMAQRKTLHDEKRYAMMCATRIRFVRASVAIIATFLLTWMPYQVLALLRVLCARGSTCEQVVSKLNWLQAVIIASTCINPFIYKFGSWRSHNESIRCSTSERIINPTSNSRRVEKYSLASTPLLTIDNASIRIVRIS
uniref:Gonadotropin-releasing hormone II receptor n=1 Tax=Ascaris suum TaxID=6253 RepID=F1L7M2_ASCSU